jgi:cell fate regulator YaaT (PSP1 superfamily)
MEYKLAKSTCGIKVCGCKKNSLQMLSVYDWLSDIPETQINCNFVEVQFKNTRKGYFLNSTDIKLEKGDIVAVESSPGHDIGTVTLVGLLVDRQMRKNGIDPKTIEVRRVYRKAKQTDLDKWEESKSKEHDAMLKSRQIAQDLKLDMKIGDVEYQGDGNKAIFYYIAEQRVDFRQLIKVLAETFQVRIEMKQIGARQEAGRIGGTGPCGRELCCSTFLNTFSSVGTHAARVQDLSLNPQKLAGQCAKLKCCLNYELSTYTEILKEFPSKDIQLEGEDCTYYFFKLDIFEKKMAYSQAPNFPKNLVELSLDKVKEIIALNKKGIRPAIEGNIKTTKKEEEETKGFATDLAEGSLTRFDSSKSKKKNNKRRKNRNTSSNEKNAAPEQ